MVPMSKNFYPNVSYQVWLYNPYGTRIGILDNLTSLSFSRAIHSIGRFQINIPEDKINRSFAQPDNVIQIWRNSHDNKRRLEFAGFVTGITYTSPKGKGEVILSGEDGLTLLKRRIVAYASGSSQAKKVDYIDDMMKEIVRENLGASATDSDRDLSSFGFSVNSDISAGPSESLSFPWKNVLNTLKKLSELSVEVGTPVFFDVVPGVATGNTSWNFDTFINQIGSDRTYVNGRPTVFSQQFGNLEDPNLSYNYSDEISYVYAGGQGEGSDREIVERSDASREKRSPWARREDFVNYTNAENTASLQSAGDSVLQKRRPNIRFTGALKDTKQTRYGVDWVYGDKVVISHRGITFSAWINAVSFSVDSQGQETIQARVEVYV